MISLTSNTSFSLACSNQNTCMILSAFSTVSIEDVASAGGEGLRWFHLAITMPDDLVKEHIARAEKSGYKALVITVDRPNVDIHRAHAHILRYISLANFTIPKNSTNLDYCFGNCLSCPHIWDKVPTCHPFWASNHLG